jgi:hypothetical protein
MGNMAQAHQKTDPDSWLLNCLILNPCCCQAAPGERSVSSEVSGNRLRPLRDRLVLPDPIIVILRRERSRDGLDEGLAILKRPPGRGTGSLLFPQSSHWVGAHGAERGEKRCCGCHHQQQHTDRSRDCHGIAGTNAE